MEKKLANLGTMLSRAQAKKIVGGEGPRTIGDGGTCSGKTSSDTCSDSCTAECNGSSANGNCSWSNTHQKCYCVVGC